MSTLLAQVAQPQPKRSTLRDRNYDFCPFCKFPKLKKWPKCRDCVAASNRPPFDPATYIVQELPCRRIPLTHSLYALVPTERYEFAIQWWWRAERTKHYTWYAKSRIRMADGSFRNISLHRLLMDLPVDDELIVDHANGHGLDNRDCNLRTCTQEQNAANGKFRVNNTSGYRGVSWAKHRSRWMALIRTDSGTKNLGHFADKVQAAKAWDIAAFERWGSFARLNFPTTESCPSRLSNADMQLLLYQIGSCSSQP